MIKKIVINIKKDLSASKFVRLENISTIKILGTHIDLL